MMPDLRFAIGAVLAVALIGVAAFGLMAAMHITHQAKLGPLEASRMLAYTPDGRSDPREPFAKILGGIDTTPPAPAAKAAVQVAAKAKAEPIAPAPHDTDTVDERAVVDPPLPTDDDPPASETTRPAGTPASETPPAVEPPPAMPVPAKAEPVESAPSPAKTAGKAKVQVEAPAGETSNGPSAKEPSPAPVEHVGSITPPAVPAVTSPHAPSPAIEPPAKRPRKAAPKARPKAVARARPAAPGVIPPTASTGYPVSTSDRGIAATPRPQRSPRGAERPLFSGD